MSTTTTATTSAPADALDADQLALVSACKDAKSKRDTALADAQTNFSAAVAKANGDFAAVVDRARKRIKTNKLAQILGINRQNLHRILSEHGPKE